MCDANHGPSPLVSGYIPVNKRQVLIAAKNMVKDFEETRKKNKEFAMSLAMEKTRVEWHKLWGIFPYFTRRKVTKQEAELLINKVYSFFDDDHELGVWQYRSKNCLDRANLLFDMIIVCQGDVIYLSAADAKEVSFYANVEANKAE
jgi:hypothetical protein